MLLAKYLPEGAPVPKPAIEAAPTFVTMPMVEDNGRYVQEERCVTELGDEPALSSFLELIAYQSQARTWPEPTRIPRHLATRPLHEDYSEQH